MKKENKNIKTKSDIQPGNASWEDNENEGILNGEDSLLFEKISGYMKGRLDYEDILNDPQLAEADKKTQEWIKENKKVNPENVSVRKFVNEAIAEAHNEEKMEKEIKKLQSEIRNNNLDEITKEWIKEWGEEKDKNTGKRIEIKKFVSESIQQNNEKPEIEQSVKIKTTGVFRYLLLSAAAVTVVFILFKSLMPTSPDNLFKSYYKPFEAVSDITRNTTANSPDAYRNAVASYRSGDYTSALKGFYESSDSDTSSVMARFFIGITHLAMGNYVKASSMLKSVSDTPGEYQKEALWYLGLAYLKTGEREKADKCFEFLEQTNGYFSERARKILRRLK